MTDLQRVQTSTTPELPKSRSEISDISIREFRAKEIPKLLTIEKSSFIDPWPVSSFLHAIWRGFICWGIYVNGGIAGYLIAVPYKQGLHLANIAVEPNHRRHGLASIMLTHLQNEGRRRNFCCITLEVRKSNTAAIRFYQKEGFLLEGCNSHYYENGEDAYMYKKELARG